MAEYYNTAGRSGFMPYSQTFEYAPGESLFLGY